MRRSDHQEVRAAFERNRNRALRFLDNFHSISDPTDLLARAFSYLAQYETAEVGSGNIWSERESLVDAFSIILNPAYIVEFDLAPYLEFLQWARQQPDWITIITTNWDQILDDLVMTSYLMDTVDEGMVDLGVDAIIPGLMEETLPAGRFCSLYKLNGSTTWFYCPNDQQFYGTVFQPPFNLDAVVRLQKTRARILSMTEGPVEIPPRLKPGHCPVCGTRLERRLYTPGVSRATFPIARRMYEYTMRAVSACRELVFVGFSCPLEDRDIVEAIGRSLRQNVLFESGEARPVVIQRPGGDRSTTKSRYEAYLGSEVDYRECGFNEWVRSLA